VYMYMYMYIYIYIYLYIYIYIYNAEQVQGLRSEEEPHPTAGCTEGSVFFSLG